MEFLNKYKKWIFTLIIIACITAAILTVNRTKPSIIEDTFGVVIIPVQSLNTNVSGWFKDKISVFTNFKDIENENASLKKEIESKAELENRVKLLEAENQKLNNLLDTDSKYSDYPKITAKIIAKDPGNWYDTFIIDRGSQDGLKKNMVVLASGGLVGRIKECGPFYSKVVSLIDDSDAVSSKSLRTDDIGFIRGDLTKKNLCRMEYIDNDAEIIEGDEIVTSHLSEIYPPGITIGYVKEITSDTNTLTKVAIIEPTVDFKHLENVLVITQSYEKTDISTSSSEEITPVENAVDSEG